MTAEPRVWVLLGKGAGGNAQMRALAEALGWPFETRQLVYRGASRIPNLLLGASRLGVDPRRSDPLEPPWPDLVIGASRRSAPVARWIRRRSGGRARLVHLFHVQGPLQHFDRILTLPQYRLPPRPNVRVLTGALNRPPEAGLAEARRRWEPVFAPLPRPWVAVVVGGDSSSYRLDPETARRLGRETSQLARSLRGSLLVSTTPRTPPEATEALFAALDAPAHRYAYRRNDPDNPYLGYLALADRFVVTVDSASLPMEAVATGRPVQVFEWPRRPPRHPLLARAAVWPGVRALYGWGVAKGLIKPARDFDAYHRELRARGIVSRLGEPARAAPEGPPDDLERAAEAVRELFPGSPRP